MNIDHIIEAVLAAIVAGIIALLGGAGTEEGREVQDDARELIQLPATSTLTDLTDDIPPYPGCVPASEYWQARGFAWEC